MNEARVSEEKKGELKSAPVVYWMQRDQRVNDNWALIYAKKRAEELGSHVVVVFNLVPGFLGAAIRQYGFMIKGLMEVESRLAGLNIPFHITLGNPAEEVAEFAGNINASHIITDFNPLRIAGQWKKELQERINIPFYVVDAHNIVPVKEASGKLEFAAYTIRPKILKKLNEFLDVFPPLPKQENVAGTQKINWDKLYKSLKINFDVKEVDWIKPGESAALEMMNSFFDERLRDYGEERNDPNKNVLSNLSPYLHFGHISAQRIVLESYKHGSHHVEALNSFREELIIRRELADNFCYYNKNYDTFQGFHEWAQKTLNEHRKDKREYLYELEQFENAQTHDDLWNAAQVEMVTTGKMHGFMRMYWAKKILEWSRTPEEALEYAIFLNDKYELDGRDPNGYVGCAWSIGGVHDRAWTERPVYGKIRYMNYNGCKRKFDVNSYIEKYI